MSALWNGLSALSQDIVMTLLLLLPALQMVWN